MPVWRLVRVHLLKTTTAASSVGGSSSNHVEDQFDLHLRSCSASIVYKPLVFLVEPFRAAQAGEEQFNSRNSILEDVGPQDAEAVHAAGGGSSASDAVRAGAEPSLHRVRLRFNYDCNEEWSDELDLGYLRLRIDFNVRPQPADLDE